MALVILNDIAKQVSYCGRDRYRSSALKKTFQNVIVTKTSLGNFPTISENLVLFLESVENRT